MTTYASALSLPESNYAIVGGAVAAVIGFLAIAFVCCLAARRRPRVSRDLERGFVYTGPDSQEHFQLKNHAHWHGSPPPYEQTASLSTQMAGGAIDTSGSAGTNAGNSAGTTTSSGTGGGS